MHQDPVAKTLPCLSSGEVFRKGLHVLWKPTIRVRFEAPYQFPAGFLAALTTCLQVYRLLSRKWGDPWIVWPTKRLSWLDLADLFDGELLESPKRLAGGAIGAARPVDRIAMDVVAWLSVAHDYPDIRPKCPARLLVADSVRGWVADCYDDRGMVISFRSKVSAAAHARSLSRSGITWEYCE